MKNGNLGFGAMDLKVVQNSEALRDLHSCWVKSQAQKLWKELSLGHIF